MKKKRILNHKLYLYLTEFFAGLSVMAVELGASRLLAPYFSSSQIVWTIIIGTIMIAMALGNIWGGRSADKDPNPDRLYRRILIAAIWIALIPVVGKYVILLIAGVLVATVNSNFLIIAAFLACVILFVFPLLLLGTVTPSLAKYSVESLSDSGKVVGTLGAYNTIGSIIGTFLPTFVTIPAVGTCVTFLIFAGILMALALVYFLSGDTGRRRPVMAAASIVIFTVCVIFGHSDSFAFWESDLVYEGESVYNYLQVKDTEESTILSTNVLFGVQSITMKDDTLSGMYYDYAMAAPLMTAHADDSDVLILGMGTGTFARQCTRYFQDMEIEGVEIDEKITKLSKEYFDLPSSVKTVDYDARAFLQGTDKKYDVIMVDAYRDITLPFQLSTTEFFSLVKSHLKEDGVMVVNMNMRTDKKDGINAYLSDTIAQVFPFVSTVDVQNSTNQELFASANEKYKEKFDENRKNVRKEDLADLMQLVSDNLTVYQRGGHILTDDKAPIELLGMDVIDDLIKDGLQYYKQIYKEQGFKGLLGA